jgi:hypothetical protein
LISPSAQRFNSTLLPRITPFRELIQRNPWPSSLMWQMSLSGKPWAVPTTENFSFLNLFSPPPEVPTHKALSLSR